LSPFSGLQIGMTPIAQSQPMSMAMDGHNMGRLCKNYSRELLIVDVFICLMVSAFAGLFYWGFLCL
jgi:hypothetical protein